MNVDINYLNSLKELIKDAPWRCNDEDLKRLLDITESLLIEYEELKNAYHKLVSIHVEHTDLLRGQLLNNNNNNNNNNNKINAYTRTVNDFPG